MCSLVLNKALNKRDSVQKEGLYNPSNGGAGNWTSNYKFPPLAHPKLSEEKPEIIAKSAEEGRVLFAFAALDLSDKDVLEYTKEARSKLQGDSVGGIPQYIVYKIEKSLLEQTGANYTLPAVPNL